MQANITYSKKKTIIVPDLTAKFYCGFYAIFLKHFFRFLAAVHSTLPKIGKKAKFALGKFFDVCSRCTARRQKSENLPSFTAEIPPHSEIPEKITNGEDYMVAPLNRDHFAPLDQIPPLELCSLKNLCELSASSSQLCDCA